MRPPQPLPGGARKELTRLLQTVGSKADYRRVLCLWLRAALGLPAAEVALALGWGTSSVYNLQSRYQHERAGALLGTGRGGRRRAWLSCRAALKPEIFGFELFFWHLNPRWEEVTGT